MSTERRFRARSALVATSWIPLALWLGTLYAIRDYDGWGAWAAAPMLLPAVFLSVGLGTAGLVGVLLDLRSHGRPDWTMVGATLLSASVSLYLVGANALR